MPIQPKTSKLLTNLKLKTWQISESASSTNPLTRSHRLLHHPRWLLRRAPDIKGALVALLLRQRRAYREVGARVVPAGAALQAALSRGAQSTVFVKDWPVKDRKKRL